MSLQFELRQTHLFIFLVYTGFVKMFSRKERLGVTVILRKIYTRIRIKTKVPCSHGELKEQKTISVKV